MKKYIIAILILLVANPVFAATWYACSGSANMSGIQWHSTTGCSGGSDLTWASRSAGDVFLANAQTGIVVDVDPGVGGEKVVLNTATNGGAFVITTGTITVTADLGVSGNTGTTDVLAVSGGTVTILGNIYGGGTANADGLAITGATAVVTIGAVGSPVTITGGSTSTTCGVNDSHTVQTTTVYATSTGGSNATGYGYQFSGATGAVVHNGGCTGAASRGCTFSSSTSATFTVNGTCTGGATAGGVGCYASGTQPITVAGNIVNGSRECGVGGNVTWTPTAPASGVTGHYVQFVGGTDVFVGTNTDDASKALTTFYYIDPTDGTSDQGSATTGGGGGAWGF